MTKLVYLDSSDFSKLSIPDAGLTRENRAILATLREHKRAGTATFFMSVIHLSEAVHAAAEHKEAAVRRAGLMRELCGSNILRLPTDLPKLELTRALAGESNPRLTVDQIKSAQGEWFGVYVPLDGMSDNRANIRRQLDAALGNLPRRERRKRQSELAFRKKSSKEKWRELLRSGARTAPLSYPFTLLDQDIAIGWFLGEISNAEFRRRTLQIMHDPYVMFKHLIDDTAQRQVLYDSLRKQGRDIADWAEEGDQELIAALLPFAQTDHPPDLKEGVDGFISKPRTLRKIISSFDVAPDQFSDADLRNIVKSCPSLFVFTEVFRSTLLSRTYSYFSRIRTGNTAVKHRSPSDFGDLMHCYYAPYFDIFRCGARFGALLKCHKPVRTRIADRIGDLPRMLSIPTEDHRSIA